MSQYKPHLKKLFTVKNTISNSKGGETQQQEQLHNYKGSITEKCQ